MPRPRPLILPAELTLRGVRVVAYPDTPPEFAGRVFGYAEVGIAVGDRTKLRVWTPDGDPLTFNGRRVMLRFTPPLSVNLFIRAQRRHFRNAFADGTLRLARTTSLAPFLFLPAMIALGLLACSTLIMLIPGFSNQPAALLYFGSFGLLAAFLGTPALLTLLTAATRFVATPDGITVRRVRTGELRHAGWSEVRWFRFLELIAFRGGGLAAPPPNLAEVGLLFEASSKPRYSATRRRHRQHRRRDERSVFRSLLLVIGVFPIGAVLSLALYAPNWPFVLRALAGWAISLTFIGIVCGYTLWNQSRSKRREAALRSARRRDHAAAIA